MKTNIECGCADKKYSGDSRDWPEGLYKRSNRETNTFIQSVGTHAFLWTPSSETDWPYPVDEVHGEWIRLQNFSGRVKSIEFGTDI